MTIEANDNIQLALDSLKLAIKSEFVPFSRSRSKAEKTPSLNWLITVTRDGRDVLTTDYMAGCGHCPAYASKEYGNRPGCMNLDRDRALRTECETGYAHRAFSKGKKIELNVYGAFSSLLCDADVISYGSFEDWAINYGYDVDSRSAEKTYRACIDIALKLRAAIGDAGLSALRVAFQDY